MQLRNLVDPKSTVVVTMEVQEGIIGESSAFTDLHQAAVSSGVLSKGPKLCQAARRIGYRSFMQLRLTGAIHVARLQIVECSQPQKRCMDEGLELSKAQKALN